MKNYQQKIMQYLNNHSQATAASLSQHLGVSIRSIKNYIHELNTTYPNIIKSSNRGYSLNLNFQNNDFLETDTNHSQIPQTPDERITYIINRLVECHNGNFINVYDLCDSLFISLSTCKSDLQKAKKKISKYNLLLHTKGDLLYIEGSEKDKRKLLSSIFYEESLNNFINYSSLQKVFWNIDIELTKQIILSSLNEYHHFINDYSLINLVLHIAISIDRIRNNNTVKQENIEPSVLLLHEYKIAKKIAQQLEKNFHISCSDTEIYEITLLIISRTTAINYKNITLLNLENFIGKECIELVQLLIQNIKTYYYIDISEPEFIIRFALHIHNLLIRSRNNYFSKNPFCDSVKATYPFLYDISVSLAQTIKERTNILLNDDEITFFVLHLGTVLEAQKNLTSKISAVLYCPSYYDMNLKITERINTFFSDDILITNILTHESDFKNLTGIDLIIATLPVNEPISVPYEIITLMLNEHDQLLIKNKILQLQYEKKRRKFETYLRKLIIPDLFERKQEIHDKIDCIYYMTKKLEINNYVDHSFRNEVLEREQLSSTAFGLVAIPHSMRMHAFKTGISVIVSDKPISWGENNVQLVIMMFFNKDDRYIFNEIFEPITMILTDSQNIKKLISCVTYDEFIKTFVLLL